MIEFMLNKKSREVTYSYIVYILNAKMHIFHGIFSIDIFSILTACQKITLVFFSFSKQTFN